MSTPEIPEGTRREARKLCGCEHCTCIHIDIHDHECPDADRIAAALHARDHQLADLRTALEAARRQRDEMRERCAKALTVWARERWHAEVEHRPEINVYRRTNQRLRTLLTSARAKAVATAKRARLPKGYQWGRDAMEQFNFGKKCAAEAIETLAVRDFEP